MRELLQSKKLQLQHWHKVYDLGRKTIPIIALLGTIIASVAYFKTKEAYWISGALTQISVLPYTLAAITPLNTRLTKVLDDSQDLAEIEESKKREVV